MNFGSSTRHIIRGLKTIFRQESWKLVEAQIIVPFKYSCTSSRREESGGSVADFLNNKLLRGSVQEYLNNKLFRGSVQEFLNNKLLRGSVREFLNNKLFRGSVQEFLNGKVLSGRVQEFQNDKMFRARVREFLLMISCLEESSRVSK